MKVMLWDGEIMDNGRVRWAYGLGTWYGWMVFATAQWEWEMEDSVLGLGAVYGLLDMDILILDSSTSVMMQSGISAVICSGDSSRACQFYKVAQRVRVLAARCRRQV